MPVGLLTVRHLLCLAVAIEARGQHEGDWSIDEIEPNLFDDVGLEYDDSLDALRELDSKNMLFPEVDGLELERIKRAMGEAAKIAEAAPQVASEVVTADSATRAEEDEFQPK